MLAREKAPFSRVRRRAGISSQPATLPPQQVLAHLSSFVVKADEW